MGVKKPRWTEEEVTFMRENAKTMTCSEVAQHLGRTPRSTVQKACLLSIKFKLLGTDGRQGWTKEELQELEMLAERYTMLSAAKTLGRSKSSVAQAAMVHKISFFKRRITNQQVADFIGVHRETVRRIRDKLGLQFRHNVVLTNRKTRTRGATGDDIAAIARHILNNPNPTSQSNLRVSAKHLRKVIADWEGYE